jgi:hypothetical protein
MGTNYTVYITNQDGDQNCEVLHIGKSSMGWVFSLRVYPQRGICTLYDWIPILINHENVIRNEYGSQITATEMLQTITVRGQKLAQTWSARELAMNHAELGPNNLLRHLAFSEYGHTTTHGEGTWDYIDHEFC